MEGFSILIEHAKQEKILNGVKVTTIHSITHPCCLLMMCCCSAMEQLMNGLLFMILLYSSVRPRVWRSVHKNLVFIIMLLTHLFCARSIFYSLSIGPLENGFKYLGYFLKPNYYGKTDWIWLLWKVEKRLECWAYIWLSLGGRLILVKAVLESIHVYWMSLAHIPVSILHGIRKKMMHFLWSGGGNKSKFHLVSWSTISLHKSMVGGGE